MSRSVACAPSWVVVRNIFENSQDEEQARAALDTLKQMPRDQRHSKPFEKVLRFLESHFEWMTQYLRKDGVNGAKFLKAACESYRLEIEHDGFRSEKGREIVCGLSSREISRLASTSIAPLQAAHPT